MGSLEYLLYFLNKVKKVCISELCWIFHQCVNYLTEQLTVHISAARKHKENASRVGFSQLPFVPSWPRAYQPRGSCHPFRFTPINLLWKPLTHIPRSVTYYLGFSLIKLTVKMNHHTSQSSFHTFHLFIYTLLSAFTKSYI